MLARDWCEVGVEFVYYWCSSNVGLVLGSCRVCEYLARGLCVVSAVLVWSWCKTDVGLE